MIHYSYFMETEDCENLMKDHDAFTLLGWIAKHCRKKGGYSDGIRVGECYMGNWKKMGFSSEKSYRTAKAHLKRDGFASFTSIRGKGTIAKILDVRVFDTSRLAKMGGAGAEQGRSRGGAQAEQGRSTGGAGASNIESYNGEGYDQEYLLSELRASLQEFFKDEKYKPLATNEFRAEMDRWWREKIAKKTPPACLLNAIDLDLEKALELGAEKTILKIRKAVHRHWNHWDYEERPPRPSADGQDTMKKEFGDVSIY